MPLIRLSSCKHWDVGPTASAVDLKVLLPGEWKRSVCSSVRQFLIYSAFVLVYYTYANRGKLVTPMWDTRGWRNTTSSRDFISYTSSPVTATHTHITSHSSEPNRLSVVVITVHRYSWSFEPPIHEAAVIRHIGLSPTQSINQSISIIIVTETTARSTGED